MKHLTGFFLIIIFAQVSLAQNGPVDFEKGGHGASWTWTTFENDDNPSLEIIANPASGGINTSATAAKFTARMAGQPYAGVETKHGEDIGKFTLTPSTSSISIMVYKPVISDIGKKLVEAGSGSLGELKVANTKINEWEKLTIDFSTMEGIEYDQIVVFMDFDARAQENVCYFDNITFGSGSTDPKKEPTSPAPDPTLSAESVMSMFSNVYTDVTVDTWRTPWSNGNLRDFQISGNDTKEYSELDFVGVETVGANVMDVSGMSYFNIDVWLANSTQFRVKLVDFGADGAFGGGDDSEHEMVFDDLMKESWNSVNIKLSEMTGLASTTHIAQLILSSNPTGSSNIFVDNVYFSKTLASFKSIATVHFNVYPNPATDKINVTIAEAGTFFTVNVVDIQGRKMTSEVSNTGAAEISTKTFQRGVYFLTVESGSSKSTKKIVIR